MDTQSVSWCKSQAISTHEFLKALGIKKHQIKSDYPSYYEYARSKELDCPFDMDKGVAPDILYSLIKELRPKFIIETGVAYGWSSLAILLGINKNHKAHLWSIDMPYPNLGNESYVGCILPDDLHDKWTLIRKPDISGLPIALNECGLIDFFHYDSDVSYDGKMNAARMVWLNLRMGGYIMSANIQNNHAFKDFCDSVKRDPLIVKTGSNYIGLIKK
ncbi:MAG: class I SAM-dependent methyltransferase [Bacteroidia bacterium]|nr:class I SAM-dependent methyltransferase [Bacteroidia bacterium]MBT8288100.1 class I SAM-dependent methyltransferase [Bacteroidia bacterium]